MAFLLQFIMHFNVVCPAIVLYIYIYISMHSNGLKKKTKRTILPTAPVLTVTRNTTRKRALAASMHHSADTLWHTHTGCKYAPQCWHTVTHSHWLQVCTTVLTHSDTLTLAASMHHSADTQWHTHTGCKYAPQCWHTVTHSHWLQVCTTVLTHSDTVTLTVLLWAHLEEPVLTVVSSKWAKTNVYQPIPSAEESVMKDCTDQRPPL